MFKITGKKDDKTITAECDKDFNFKFNGAKNENYETELELLMKSPSAGGTYLPEEKTHIHAYLILKERFFDDVLTEEVGDIGELEYDPNLIY